MLKTPFLTILFLSSVILSSCVSSKKFKSANNEIDKLTTENTSLQKTVDDLQKTVNDLTNSNKSVMSEYSNYKTDCEAIQKEYESFQTILEDEFAKLKEVERLLDSAVGDFAGQGVEVYSKDGRIYVNLQDKLLYKSGSSVLAAQGKSALAALASALNQYPNLMVIVVGHTDNVPFKGGHKDNLDLSTERADGVVRVLRDEYNVDPKRMVAAGQGLYAPVADNATAEGRSKNRRTEIILNPDMNKIWQMAENKKGSN